MYRLLMEFYSRKQERQIASFSEPSSIRVKIGSYSLGRSFRPAGYAEILIESSEKGSNIRFLFDLKIYYIVAFAFEVLAITLLLTKSLPDYLKGQSLFELAILVINQISTWQGEDRPVGGDAISRYAILEIQLQRRKGLDSTHRWMVIRRRKHPNVQRLLVQLDNLGFQAL